MESNQGLMQFLQDAGVELSLAANAEEMEARLGSQRFDVLVSDIARPDNPEGGVEAIELLQAREQELPAIIFFAARMTTARVRKVNALGALMTTEPMELLELLASVARAKRNDTLSQNPDHGQGSPRWSSRFSPPRP
jgi:DNA-binding NtrC family response regulator